MSFCIHDQRPGGDLHGLQLLPFIIGVRIGKEIERFFRLPDITDNLLHALPVDLVAENRMTGCPLFLEFGEDAGIVGILPGSIHVCC